MKNSNNNIDHIVLKYNKDRKIISDVGDSSWGQLFLSAPEERRGKNDEGFRILLFGSYLLGYLLLETLKIVDKQNPGLLNIVGLVTDDPVSPNAKISVKRRIYRLYNNEQIVNLEDAMLESALSVGISVYTGAVRTEYFRKLLNDWKPDAIFVCVFGQIIDKPIIDYPDFGIYNFHPSDLLHNMGAGPQPFQDLINRNASTSKVTVHHLTEKLDGGPVVGQSSDVNVRNADGSITDNILILDDKMLKPIDIMGSLLIKDLIKKKQLNIKGPVSQLDFAKHFSDRYKKMLMEPVTEKKPCSVLPEPSKMISFKL